MKENNVVTSETKDALSLGHSRIQLRHLHILVTEHLADGLHRHTCLKRNEAGERVSSRMVGIGKSVLFSTSTSKAFWMEINKTTITAIILLILRSFQKRVVQ